MLLLYDCPRNVLKFRLRIQSQLDRAASRVSSEFAFVFLLSGDASSYFQIALAHVTVLRLHEAYSQVCLLAVCPS